MRHSEGSYHSESSERSEGDAKPALEIVHPNHANTHPHYDNQHRSEAIVRIVTPTNEPVEPIETKEDVCLTTLTTVTTQKHSEANDPYITEMQALYRHVKSHVATMRNRANWSGNLFWYGLGTGYENETVTPEEYGKRVLACRDSGDQTRIKSAMNTMRRTLGIEEE